MEQRGPGTYRWFPEISTPKGFLRASEQDIQDALDKLDYMNDPEAVDKEAELKGMDIACDAIMLLASRYADLAEKMAAECGDETVERQNFCRSRKTAELFRQSVPELTGRQSRCTGLHILA